jgi:hypothetical protein
MLEQAAFAQSKRNVSTTLRKRTSVVLVMSRLLGGAIDIFAMSSDLKKANRKLLEEFIPAYESQSCLWRIKSKDYHDKAKRDAA